MSAKPKIYLVRYTDFNFDIDYDSLEKAPTP